MVYEDARCVGNNAECIVLPMWLNIEEASMTVYDSYKSKEGNIGPRGSVVMSRGKDAGGAWNCSVSSGLFIDKLWQHNFSVMVLSP